jgi:TRAP transporter 4TM/12TM fusion protein
MRDLRGLYGKIAAAWIAAASLFHLYTAAFGVLEPRLQRAYHLLFLLPGAFLYFPATKKSPRDRFTRLDVIFALLTTVPCLLLIIEIDRLNFRFEHVTDVLPREFIVGALAVILLIEAVRRAVVPAMAVLGGFVVFYLMTCQYFPKIFHHRAFELPRVVEQLYLLKDEGIYGSITGVSATFVALFVIFGAFIHGSGTGRFFTNVACKLAGGTRGGPAKIAVVSSGLFGAISGVAAANVYTTGTFSIPLMKHLGYRPQFAGSVEAAASTGGMIMPPIMGAGAFVMAEITGIPYLQICLAATIGAVMYYFSIGMMVHLEAVKYNLKSMSKEELPSLGAIIKDAYLILPLVGLVYLLIIGYSPFMAAFAAILFSIGIMLAEWLVREARFAHEILTDPKGQGDDARSNGRTILSHALKGLYACVIQIKDCLIQGGKNMIMVALACAGAGLVISAITNTGLGITFSSVIVAYSKGITFLALIFIMIASITLGMGLPCTPAYIIAVSVGAPAMMKIGGDLLASHLFVYYFAILAAVTPPVCIAAYAGAALAGTNPLKTGFEAFKLAIAGFFVPYVFYFDHALLMRGSFMDISSSVVRIMVVIILFAIALEGWFLRAVPMIARGLLLGTALVLPFVFSSKLLPILVGLAMLIALFLVQSWIAPERKEITIEGRGG